MSRAKPTRKQCLACPEFNAYIPDEGISHNNCSTWLCNNGLCPYDNKLECKTCNFREPCEKEFGKISGHGDDCTAVIGTHFCRASWKQLKNFCHPKK